VRLVDAERRHGKLRTGSLPVVAKKYPDVTAEQLKASVREAAKGGKSDSEIAQALRGKYKGADFEDLLAGVREAALKGAEHDQLLKAIRQATPTLTDQGQGDRQDRD
jgi:ABC-type transporter Mla subunit MlaD